MSNAIGGITTGAAASATGATATVTGATAAGGYVVAPIRNSTPSVQQKQVVDLTPRQDKALGKFLLGVTTDAHATPKMQKAIDFVKSLDLTPQETAGLGHFLDKSMAPDTGLAMTPKMREALQGIGVKV